MFSLVKLAEVAYMVDNYEEVKRLVNFGVDNVTTIDIVG
jgi:hypothetical protein